MKLISNQNPNFMSLFCRFRLLFYRYISVFWDFITFVLWKLRQGVNHHFYHSFFLVYHNYKLLLTHFLFCFLRKISGKNPFRTRSHWHFFLIDKNISLKNIFLKMFKIVKKSKNLKFYTSPDFFSALNSFGASLSSCS